jgi:hypothetical protein
VAENETLTVDGRTASRWRPLRERLASGEPPTDCFPEVEREFYRALKKACRQWVSRGVSLEGLLTAAAGSPEELEALVRRTRNQDHARHLLDVVRSQTFLSLEPLVSAWLSAVWDSVRDLLQLDLNGRGPGALFEGRIKAMLNRLARLIARTPSRIPKLPPRPKDPPDDLDGTLRRSIL